MFGEIFFIFIFFWANFLAALIELELID